MRSRALASVTLALSFSVLTTACLERYAAPINPHLGFAQRVEVGGDGRQDVDLLIIVDDSGSMAVEQQNLAARIGDLVEFLANPDEDGDGRPDFGVPRSIRIAVTTTDLGVSGATVSGTGCSARGRDGMFVAPPACGGGAIQTFDEGDDPSVIAGAVSCIVDSVGTAGCGLEQQLGASTRALEQGASSDFPRADSIFAVLVLTDEEDCSLANPEAFFAGFAAGNGDVLCQRTASGHDGRDPAWLTSPLQIAETLRGSRPDDAFIFTAIAGVPPELSGRPPTEILADSRMQYGERVGPRGITWTPVCTRTEPSGDLAEAAPARRIVQAAAAMPGSSVHSICTDDFRPAVLDLARRIVAAVDGACLARRVPAPTDGRVDCIVRETLPPTVQCGSLPGRVFVGVNDARDREVCEVDQVRPDSGSPGWFYDASGEECGRISYAAGAEPPLGADVSINCYFEVDPSTGSGPTSP